MELAMHGSQFVEARRGNGIKNRAWHSQTDFKPQDLSPDSNARALLERFTTPEPPHCSKSIPHSGYLDRLPGGEPEFETSQGLRPWYPCGIRARPLPENATALRLNKDASASTLLEPFMGSKPYPCWVPEISRMLIWTAVPGQDGRYALCHVQCL